MMHCCHAVRCGAVMLCQEEAELRRQARQDWDAWLHFFVFCSLPFAQGGSTQKQSMCSTLFRNRGRWWQGQPCQFTQPEGSCFDWPTRATGASNCEQPDRHGGAGLLVLFFVVVLTCVQWPYGTVLLSPHPRFCCCVRRGLPFTSLASPESLAFQSQSSTGGTLLVRPSRCDAD